MRMWKLKILWKNKKNVKISTDFANHVKNIGNFENITAKLLLHTKIFCKYVSSKVTIFKNYLNNSNFMINYFKSITYK